MKKIIKSLFAIALSFTLSSCFLKAENNQTVKPIATTVTTTESPAPSSSSTSASDALLEKDFDAMLKALQEHVFPGSAGSSLNAASQGATLLSWYVNNKVALTKDTISSWLKKYVESTDDKDMFKQQLNMVTNWIKSATDDLNKQTLVDAGYQGEVNWQSEDCETLASALTLE